MKESFVPTPKSQVCLINGLVTYTNLPIPSLTLNNIKGFYIYFLEFHKIIIKYEYNKELVFSQNF